MSTLTTMLAVLSGAGITAGLLIVWSGLFGETRAAVARPPSRWAAWVAAPFQPRLRRLSASSAAVGVGVLVTTRWPAAAIAAAAATVFLPRVMSGRPVARQLARLDGIEQWVRKLAALLGASRGLEDALQTSAGHAPAAIQPEVSQLTRRMRAGMSIDEALYRFADDLDDPIGDLVTGALIHAARVRGRGVQQLLTDLAGMVAADVAGRREVEASRAPHRTTIRGLAIIVTLFAAALAARRDYSAPYGTLAGQLVLAAVLGCCGAGLWTMHRLASQAPVGRFLTKPRGFRDSEGSSATNSRAGGAV